MWTSFNKIKDNIYIEYKNKAVENKNNCNNIKFVKRTLLNDTHEVFEDQNIKSITSWRKSKSKFYKILILNIISFGLLHLISLYYPHLYIMIYCKPWPGKECDFFLVENIFGQYTLCIKIHKNQKSNHLFSINSDASNEKILTSSFNNKSLYDINKKLIYCFNYKSMIYEYNLEKNEIIPVYMDLSEMTNKSIINFFCEGLSTKNLVKEFEERYGKNEFKINLNLFHLYFKRVELPFYLIIISIGIGELFLKDFFAFISKLISIILMVLFEYIFAINIVYKNYKNENTLDGEKFIKVKRKYLIKDENIFYIEIKNKDLLPGDILYLKSNDYVPCDCVIIEGKCLVNQNNTTGNLDILKKTAIANNNQKFNYQTNKTNILLHGMKVVKTFSKIKEGYISVLCINTGPNTFKANQYSNILNSSRDLYNFFGDDRISIFIGIISLFFMSIILGFIYSYLLKMTIELKTIKNLIIPCLFRTLFKSLMPVYFITHYIIILIGIYNLKKQNIFCYDKCRLLHSYNIDTIFISKANILCENKLELISYNPVINDNHKSNNISYKTYKVNQIKEMNIQLLYYYKEYITQKMIDKRKNIRSSLRISYKKKK